MGTTEWKLEKSDIFDKRLARFKHKDAADQALLNATTYLEALKSGLNPMQIKYGFVHPEPKGSVAVDARGSRKEVHETRLYLYADVNSKTLHFITIGDKTTQSRGDITYVTKFVTNLKKPSTPKKHRKR